MPFKHLPNLKPLVKGLLSFAAHQRPVFLVRRNGAI
jgi:hypothetical protein